MFEPPKRSFFSERLDTSENPRLIYFSSDSACLHLRIFPPPLARKLSSPPDFHFSTLPLCEALRIFAPHERKPYNERSSMNENVILSGLHMELTDALKSIVAEKVERLYKHEDAIIRIRIELERATCSTTHSNEYVAKGHLELKGTTITISSASDDLYKSIDDLVNKLDRGLRRRSRLLKVKRKQGSIADTMDTERYAA